MGMEGGRVWGHTAREGRSTRVRLLPMLPATTTSRDCSLTVSLSRARARARALSLAPHTEFLLKSLSLSPPTLSSY